MRTSVSGGVMVQHVPITRTPTGSLVTWLKPAMTQGSLDTGFIDIIPTLRGRLFGHVAHFA